MKQTYVNILVAVAILVVLSTVFYLGRGSKQCNEFAERVVVKRDTFIVVKAAPPIKLERAKAKIKYLRDTIIETKPFEARIDTIINNDTIYLWYNYPMNAFDLFVKKKPDSTIVHEIYITKEVIRKRAWWEAPAFIAAGAAAGYVIGIKK